MLSKKILVPFGIYFLILAGVAAHAPYRVLYYQSLSFTGTQIGLLTGIAPLVTIFSIPLLTGFADRTQKHKPLMTAALIVVVAILVVFPYVKSFLPLFGLVVFFTIFFSLQHPLMSSASMFMLGGQKDLYGRVRLGGTFGFSLMALVAGFFVENYGLKIAFWGAAGIFVLALLLSQQLAHGSEESKKQVDWRSMAALLKKPHFQLFLLIGLSGGVSFATLNIYLFPYMKVLGAGESLMGVALTVGTLIEIPVLFFSNRFVGRFKAYHLLLLSLAMTGLRFLLLAVAPNPIFVLFVQLPNGLNYPFLTVAGVAYAEEYAPAGFRATAQGLFYVAYAGIGSAIGGFAGGLLFESLGAKGMYLAFCIFVSIVLVAVSLIHRSLPLEEENIPVPSIS
jgi:PPP family 3-phenylpropionic acid transporter